MCGIVGVLGAGALEKVHAGLKRLEYRGYDSAGVAWLEGPGIEVLKATGRVTNLEVPSAATTLAVGHTRWATHGGVTVANSHPHLDATGSYAVVHNGTLDNFRQLKADLDGHEFRSETDSEVLAHLYEVARRTTQPVAALEHVFSQVDGSWAAVFLDPDGGLAFACEKTPLVVGILDEGFILASDVTAIVEHTKRVVYLEDGDYGYVSAKGLDIRSAGKPKAALETTVDWDIRSAEKAGYPHFMAKEMAEVPQAINQVLAGRLRLDPLRVDVAESDLLSGVHSIKIIGCGSSYHSGLLGQAALEEWAGIPTEAVLAHHILERPLLAEPGTLFVAVSQSGETLDTLQAVRRVRSAGYPVLGVCNVQGSSLTRLADETVLVRVGPEIAVASTKAVIGQAVVLQLLALQLGLAREWLPRSQLRALAAELLRLPRETEAVLATDVTQLAKALVAARHVFFLGSSTGEAIAREAALKFKEITYLPAEAYHSSELKHGPFALLDEETAVVLCSDNELVEMEIGARDAETYRLGFDGVAGVLQVMRIAYAAACLLDTDVDQPRNLAKSVTVG